MPPRFGIRALLRGSRAARQDPEEPFDASPIGRPFEAGMPRVRHDLGG